MSRVERLRAAWRGASRRTRALLVGAALAVPVLVGTVALATSGDGAEDEPRGQARPAGEGGMQGMEMGGMQMGGGAVRLTAAQVREFGITFGFAEERTLADEVRTVGIVNFDETRIAHVAPRFSGFAERLYVDFTGQAVRRGQPLLEIYSPELVAAQEELLLAARLQQTMGESTVPGVGGAPPDLVAAARRRLLLWDISPAQVDQVLRTGRVRRTLTLHAPVSGIVVEKSVSRGQAVQAGQTLYTLADLTRLWVEAELREADAATIREGTAATVELGALPGRPIAGTVEYVYPTLQQEARTLKARISLPNPGGELKPGMYATVRLSAPARTALTVPASALVRTGERTLVFVDLGGGRLAAQEVETGRITAEYAEVLSGVEPGQRVVTSAQFLLDSESNLAEVMRSMVGMGADMGSMDMGGMEMGGMEMGGGGMEGMEAKGAPVKGRPPAPRER